MTDNMVPEWAPTSFTSDILKFDDAESKVEEKPAETGQQIVAEALEVIRSRPFSGRHPELGKMIKCVHCRLRHRENERKCEQKFATGRYDLRDPKPLLVAGKTPETSSLKGVTARSVLGATYFAKRRIKPHSNRWKSARENHLAAKELELKKRLAKPLDVWPNDLKELNGPDSVPQ